MPDFKEMTPVYQEVRGAVMAQAKRRHIHADMVDKKGRPLGLAVS